MFYKVWVNRPKFNFGKKKQATVHVEYDEEMNDVFEDLFYEKKDLLIKICKTTLDYVNESNKGKVS